MSLHTIRLRGPWQWELIERLEQRSDAARQARRDDQPPGGTTHAPGNCAGLLGEGFVGSVRFCRRFNCPTNLEPHERVWLVVEGALAQAAIALNGEPLGTIDANATAGRYDVTERLKPHNELAVDVRAGEPHEPGFAARLEIGPQPGPSAD